MAYRVLVVSPHFPPINAPDHQRVRMSLPYLEKFGWEAHVLAVKPEQVEGGIQDPLLMQTVPAQIPVTYVDAIPYQKTRRFKIGSLALRCLPYLQRAGDQLLQQQRFDLVFFSTTMFGTMTLGPRWHKRYQVPYVLDFQDPWVSDYYKQPGAPAPPGGRLKYGIAQLAAKFSESKVAKYASHTISVSPAYPKALQQRYPSLHPDRFTVLPFGAPEADFDLLRSRPVKQTIFDPNDGKRHWVYVGRGGKDMELALRSLFLSIQAQRQQHLEPWQSIQLHFVGTSYAPEALAAKTVEPIAQDCGIGDLVSEHTSRIPYFEAMQVLTDSDAILLIGSNDASYTASKLYPCVLAQKPILAIFHQSSSVVDILNRCQAGTAITFTSNTEPQTLVPQLSLPLQQLLEHPKGYTPSIDWIAFQPYTAQSMTHRQCDAFSAVLHKL